MTEYRIRLLGRSNHEGFIVTRREGDDWVWLPVRFSSHTAADQWITQRLEVDRRAIVKKPQRLVTARSN